MLVGRTTPVGAYPGNGSPYGREGTGVAGNVGECTSSLYRPYPYRADDGREDPEAEGVRVVDGFRVFEQVRPALPVALRITLRCNNDKDDMDGELWPKISVVLPGNEQGCANATG